MRSPAQLVLVRRLIHVLRWFSLLTGLVLTGAAGLFFQEYLFAMMGKPSTSCSSSPAPHAHSWLQGESNLRIAFVASPGEDREIFTMDLVPRSDGGFSSSVPINISNSAHDDRSPSWSPDGTRIAFQSGRDGNHEIYVMQSDGSAQTRITNEPADDGWPSWSPDGKQIVFCSRRDGNWEIYIMDADGKNIRRKTNHASNDAYPRWSPDGRKIAFSSDREGNWEIYTMDADGGEEKGLVRLTDSPRYQDIRPTWSADSTRIIFASSLNDLVLSDSRLLEIRAENGTIVRNLQQRRDGMYQEPSWSPDGIYLAYALSTDKNIYGMNVEQLGSPVLLTSHSSVMGKMNAEASLWSSRPPGKFLFLPIITRGDPSYYCPRPTPSPTPTSG